jgi:hypothetical protein
MVILPETSHAAEANVANAFSRHDAVEDPAAVPAQSLS